MKKYEIETRELTQGMIEGTEPLTEFWMGETFEDAVEAETASSAVEIAIDIICEEIDGNFEIVEKESDRVIFRNKDTDEITGIDFRAIER